MSKPPMKVLWIFSSFGLDAPARRFASIVGRLGSEYEHVIGSMSGDFEAEALIPDGVEWRRIALPPSKRGGVSVANMWSFRKALTHERPNLLITSNWEAIEWLMVNRGPGAAPHIHFEDPFGREERLDVDDPKRAWSRRRALPGRNRAYVSSTPELASAFSELWGAPAAETHLIPTGVDLELFPQRDHTDARRPIVIGAAGPVTSARRFDRIVRMTATLVERGRDVRAVILGEGPEKKALITEAETAGVQDRIQFVGAVTGCARIFSEIDVYVAAGARQRDASGLLAAMASGVPVVGLDVDGVREMVDASNRLFIRPSDDESGMIAAAELAVSDAELRERLGRANRVKAENDFDLGALAKRYDELFRQVAGVSNYLALPAPAASEPPEKDAEDGRDDGSEGRDPKTAETRPTEDAPGETRAAASQDMDTVDSDVAKAPIAAIEIPSTDAETPAEPTPTPSPRHGGRLPVARINALPLDDAPERMDAARRPTPAAREAKRPSA